MFQVKNNPSYQIADSSALDTPLTASQQNKDTVSSTQLLEDVDEVIEILPQKKQTNQPAKVDSVYYGIKNEQSIPTRGFEHSEVKEPVKILFDPTAKITTVFAWQTIVLLASISLLGFTKAFNNSRFKQVVKSLFSYKTAVELVREEKVFYHRVNLLLSTLHLLISGLFIYQLSFLLKNTGQNIGILFYLKIVLFLLAVYAFKYIFTRILALIFDQQFLASQYIYSVTSYNNLLGISLIPILLIFYFTTLPFSSILYYLALPILLILFGLRIFRLVLIGNAKSISYVYIFLYICSLEILPLVVMMKFFILGN